MVTLTVTDLHGGTATHRVTLALSLMRLDEDVATLHNGTLVADHLYLQPGRYVVRLTVTDLEGETTTQETELTVNAVPIARITYLIEGLTLRLDGRETVDPDGTLRTFRWDWGDGTPGAEGLTAAHTYAKPGRYTVTLTVEDDAGGTASASATIEVKEEASQKGRVPIPAAPLAGALAALAVAAALLRERR